MLKQWATKFDAVKEGGREGECAVAYCGWRLKDLRRI